MNDAPSSPTAMTPMDMTPMDMIRYMQDQLFVVDSHAELERIVHMLTSDISALRPVRDGDPPEGWFHNHVFIMWNIACCIRVLLNRGRLPIIFQTVGQVLASEDDESLRLVSHHLREMHHMDLRHDMPYANLIYSLWLISMSDSDRRLYAHRSA